MRCCTLMYHRGGWNALPASMGGWNKGVGGANGQTLPLTPGYEPSDLSLTPKLTPSTLPRPPASTGPRARSAKLRVAQRL